MPLIFNLTRGELSSLSPIVKSKIFWRRTRQVSVAFHPSKPAGLVSGSLKFLFSSLLPSEATVSAPKRHVGSCPPARPRLLSSTVSFSLLSPCCRSTLPSPSGRQISLEVLSFSLPCVSRSLPSSFSTSRCDCIELPLTYRDSHPSSFFAFIPSRLCFFFSSSTRLPLLGICLPPSLHRGV